jgi:glycosyltransferase involved in cell wall biosynthesis
MNAAERVVRKCERVVYRGYASKPDMLITNSEPVASRIHRYWGQSRHRTTVIYPPVSCDEYGPDMAETGDYYLSLSRLGLHKGVPEIAEAFHDVDGELRIAGDGEKRDQVETAAAGHENIDVLGYVSEQRKRELLAGAKALIVNSVNEDFGINAAEALASGTPIIGVREGMTQYLARDGVTGITFERGSLPSAIERFEREGVALSEPEIAACADQFGADRFGAEMRQAVKAARERSSVEPAFSPPGETEDEVVEVDLGD